MKPLINMSNLSGEKIHNKPKFKEIFDVVINNYANGINHFIRILAQIKL